MSGPRPLPVHRRLLYSVIVLLGAMVVLELSMAVVERWVLPSTRSTLPSPAPARRPAAEEARSQGAALVEDGEGGWTLAPHQFSFDVRTNSLKMRGPELPETRAPGGVRLLTLGDSSIFGFGVAEDEIFAEVAADRLSDAWDRPVRAFHGAVPGHTSTRAIGTLDTLAPAIEPDFVVIGCLWSDIYAEARQAPPVQPGVATMRRLATWRVTRRALAPLLRPIKVRWIASADDIGSVEIDGAAGTRTPLPTYLQNLRSLAERSRGHGAEPVFLVLPAPIDFDPAPLPETIVLFRLAMAEVAAEQGALLVDGPGYFAEAEAGPGWFLDQVHPSAKGHALLGDALSEALLDSKPPR